MNDGVDFLECLAQPFGVQADACDQHPGWRRLRRFRADDGGHPVPLFEQALGDVPSDEAGCAGDGDVTRHAIAFW